MLFYQGSVQFCRICMPGTDVPGLELLELLGGAEFIGHL